VAISQVFVTDAQMRSCLAVIRSLGKKGVTITAGEETMFATGFFSKYCKRHVVYPSPNKNREAFADYLLRILKGGSYNVLFPVADACLAPIIDNEREISRYTTIALPQRDIFMQGYDKGITLKTATKSGIPCPKTYFVNNLDELLALIDNVEYPVVIKPRISSGRRGTEICNSVDELITKYKKLEVEYKKMLIQEYIPSDGEVGIYTLFNQASEPRALTVQRRLRSYPVAGGPSTLRETIKNDITERTVKIAFKLLKDMKWVGVAMVEFRIDARDGIPKLMEINPRFWGSLQLSILSGVDFPYLLYRMIIEGDIEPVLDYSEGIRCRWLLPGDILWFLSAPNKAKNLKEFLKFDCPDDIISWEDPGPMLGFTLATLRYAFDAEMRKFILRKGAR
jgi:predicted ATP-grasp superfamily ATP-dependent carboligase